MQYKRITFALSCSFDGLDAVGGVFRRRRDRLLCVWHCCDTTTEVAAKTAEAAVAETTITLTAATMAETAAAEITSETTEAATAETTITLATAAAAETAAATPAAVAAKVATETAEAAVAEAAIALAATATP